MNTHERLTKIDNKGSTLIEVIVSVLIMAVVFVPLLIGMTTALKANNTSESKMYADNVAAKCAEIMKSSSSKAGVETAFTNAGLSVTANTQKTDFTISSIHEGTKEYSVSIKIEDDGTVDATEYKSIDDISGNRKALVKFRVFDDYKALQRFAQHKNTPKYSIIGMTQLLEQKNVNIVIYKVSDTDDIDDGEQTEGYAIAQYVEYVMPMKDATNSDMFDGISNSYVAGKTWNPETNLWEYANTQYYDSIPEGVLIFTPLITGPYGVNAGGRAVSDALYQYCYGIDNSIGAQSSHSNVCATLSQSIKIDNRLSKDEIEKTPKKSLSIYCFLSGVSVLEDYGTSMLKLDVVNVADASNLKIYSPLGILNPASNYEKIDSIFQVAKDEEVTKLYKATITVKDVNNTSSEPDAQVESTVLYRN